VLAALATGWLSQRGWDRSVVWLFVAMGIGHVLILGAGFAWLAFGMKLGAALVPAIRRPFARRAWIHNV
jgi:biotin transport system substrate-specific component